MRAAIDFETWGWSADEPVNPYCVTVLSESGDCLYHCDDANGSNPEVVRRFALGAMQTFTNRGVTEFWAHNAGKFEVCLLVKAAYECGYNTSAVLAGGSNAVVTTFHKRSRADWKPIKLYDSRALVPFQLGHKEEPTADKPCPGCCACDFELPSKKLFQSDDYAKDVRTWDKEKLRLGNYLDCKLVLELLDKVESIAKDWGGKIKPTFSSLALSVVWSDLRARGVRFPSHDRPELVAANLACNVARKGARTEVFHHLPERQLREYDVTSCYPWAMTQPLPWEFREHTTSKEALERALVDSSQTGCIEAEVTVPDSQFPPLPYRPSDHGDGCSDGLYFPIGSWRSTFSVVELRYALERGCKVKPIQGYLYTAETHLAEFVAKAFAAKQASKGATRAFHKLVLNGCSGKFGQNPELETLMTFANPVDGKRYLDTKPSKPLVDDDSRFIVALSERWPKQTHFALSAAIFAYARVKLCRGLMACTGAVYSDTDSIHTVDTGSEDAPWPVGDGLGEWKIELDNYRAEFFAPKTYMLRMADGKWHYAAKGFPVNRETFSKLIAGATCQVCQSKDAECAEHLIVQNSVSPLKTTVRHGLNCFLFERQKAWHGVSSKRRVTATGATVPWTVEELMHGENLKQLAPQAHGRHTSLIHAFHDP